ncbi:hypothetical protein ACN28S_30140 [Cystobacter fuscus]
MFVLSAKSEEQLKTSVARTKSHIETHPSLNLQDLAYTLQLGREPMTQRLALVAATRQELLAKLTRYIEGDRADDIFTGQVKKGREKVALLAAHDDLGNLFDSTMDATKCEKLASLWVKGLAVDWERLYASGKPQRIPLPVYPFARQRYWLAAAPQATAPVVPQIAVLSSAPAAPSLVPAVTTKPLADANILLKPVWDVVSRPESRTLPVSSGRVVVVGGRQEHWEQISSSIRRPSACVSMARTR